MRPALAAKAASHPIARLDNDRFLVIGSTNAYVVEFDGHFMRCECAASMYGSHCAHIYAAQHYVTNEKKETMSNGQALAVVSQSTNLAAPVARSIDEVMTIAKVFADSGFFKDSTNIAKAAAKILAGQELGVGPMAAMSMIHIVEGKPTMDATLVGSKIKSSGRYDYQVISSTDTECVLEFLERGKIVGRSEFTMDDAKRANLAGKNVWKSYPKDMLRSRALTRGARTYCPDVFNGAIYTPEEIGANVVVEGDTVKVIDVTPERTPEEIRSDREYAEKMEIVKRLYSMMKVAVPKGTPSNDPLHARARDVIALELGLSETPASWSLFTIDDLRHVAATGLAIDAYVEPSATDELPA